MEPCHGMVRDTGDYSASTVAYMAVCMVDTAHNDSDEAGTEMIISDG